MSKCPICGRKDSDGWCIDCSEQWEALYGTAEFLAEWAANRARKFYNKEIDND